jgi:hypothetical protein
MSDAVRAVERFRRRLAVRLVLRRAVPLLALWLLAWGAVVVLLRAGFGAPRPPVLLGLLGLPAALLTAFLLARRGFPDPDAVRALLDRLGRRDGLLLAAGERDLGAWGGALGPIETPRVIWRGGRRLSLLAAATAFLLLAYLLPDRGDGSEMGNRLDVEPEVSRLAGQLDELQRLGLIEEGRASALKESLQRVQEEAKGKEPGRALEALDRARDAAAAAARGAAEKAARQDDELARAEAAAEALRRAGPDLDPKRREEALARLTRAVREAGGRLDPGAAQAALKGAPTPEALKGLAEAARAGRRDIARDLERLRGAGLLDRAALRRLEEGASAGRAGPAGKPDWGKETSPQADKFREAALPPAALAARKEELSRPQRVRRPVQGPTLEDDPGGPARSGALEGADAGGGSAAAAALLPRHRAAVLRYFDRAETPGVR